MEDILNRIDSFEGKRNTVITMFFPPKLNFKKQMVKIQRIVKGIKNANKRHQIFKVLNLINDENEDREYFEPYGSIICAAFDKKGLPFYNELDVKKEFKIVDFEYYYDYVFNTNRIREILFSSTIIRPPYDEQKKILSHAEGMIIACNNTIVLEDLALYSLEIKMCMKLLFLKNETIPLNLIELAKTSGVKIVIFNTDKLECREFMNKYGKLVSILRYPMEIKKFEKN